MGRAERDGLTVTDQIYTPCVGGYVVFRVGAFSGGPVVQFHDLDVHLQPVAHLVFGGVYRPMVREGDVGHVVKPHGVVEGEGVVTVAP